MRIMVKFWVPVEASKAAIRNGKLEKVFGQLLEDLKPEAGYFYPATVNAPGSSLSTLRIHGASPIRSNASSSASTPGLNLRPS